MVYMPHVSTRATTVEDIFYPSDPLRLGAEVGRLLDASPAQPEGAAAIVTPHAALQFAGSVMAAAMKAASGRELRRVVVLAPIHWDPPDGFVLPESHVFQCPLGDIEVDRQAVEDLLGCGTVFTRNDIPHLEEHSIEVLLPFIRYLFPGALLLPILTGKAGKRSVLALARALELCFGAEAGVTLFVASTCAAGSFPRGRGTIEEADRLLELVAERRWEEILQQTDRGLLSCCGARPLASVLAFGNIAAETRVLARSSSADESGERVIHYAAVACRAAR
jgi:AmmeMemoRadiSam system protein B